MNNEYKPGLAFHFLTPFYDAATSWLGAGPAFMRKVLEIPSLKGNEKVLDVGCGTGTLIIEAKRKYPDIDINGIDADEAMLRRAEKKLRKAGIQARLSQGFLQNPLPFPNTSFDLIFSTLVFHHLSTDVKRQAIKEIYRILKGNGCFLLVDFGKPENIGTRILLNLGSIFDGGGNLRANLRGDLPFFLQEAGFQVTEVRPRYRTLQFLLAKKPASGESVRQAR
ncbi:MAG: class I SAM-dependent methyltransferase [Chloroflexota bacterium]